MRGRRRVCLCVRDRQRERNRARERERKEGEFTQHNGVEGRLQSGGIPSSTERRGKRVQGDGGEYEAHP